MNSDREINIPSTMKRWILTGAGMENLRLETVPTPEPGAGELLVRHDACGICYSDIKIINLGPEHPRLQGHDMVKKPVVIGHEVCVTVVKVGSELTNRFKVGQRFTIQVDIFYRGERLTYGYKLSGGMAQYGIIGKEILDGDEGCYLLPLKDTTQDAAAALCEPWACVTAAYRAKYRTGLKPGGALLFVSDRRIDNILHGDFIDFTTTNRNYPADVQDISPTGLNSLNKCEGKLYDDIVVSWNVPESFISELLRYLKPGGIINIALKYQPQEPISVDIGRIHYHGIQIIGIVEMGILDSAIESYESNTRTDLKPGGKALFVGAGGPMGQMHVQRAITLKNPPKLIVLADINLDRLNEVYLRFFDLANSRNVELAPFCSDEDETDIENHHRDLAEVGDFDDIVSLVPSAKIVPFGLKHLAADGVFNVFAGVQIGSMASIDIGKLIAKNQRIIGTTGSTIEDMRYTLELVESGELDPMRSLAAIGGLDALRDGLDAVRNGKYGGKVMIFPNVDDLPLTAVVEPEIDAILRRKE